MRKYLFALVAAGVLGGGPAHAVTQTFSSLFVLQDVELNDTLSVPQFDPSLGTLLGVTYSITGSIASILGVTNNSPGMVTGSAFTSVDFDLDSTAISLAASPDFNVFATTGPVPLDAGQSALFPVTASTTIMGAEAPSAAFIGLGTVDLNFLTSTSFGGSGFGGDIAISQATDAGIMFEITYEFDSAVVPLPASAPLLALATGFLGWMSIRRSRSSMKS